MLPVREHPAATRSNGASVSTKEAWEVAWDGFDPATAADCNSRYPANSSLREREIFKAGYLAALAEAEATVRVLEAIRRAFGG